MGTGNAGRYWALGGALTAIVLIAAGWIFLIGPQRTQTRELTEQATAAQDRVTGLQHRLVELREQQENIDSYKEQMGRAQRALPATSGVPSFLRQLQAAGDSVGVAVSGIVVGAPVAVEKASMPVYALPITVTATGGFSRLERFLDQLQQVQPRAVLITAVAASPTDDSGTLDGRAQLIISLKAFVAPSLGQNAPSLGQK